MCTSLHSAFTTSLTVHAQCCSICMSGDWSWQMRSFGMRNKRFCKYRRIGISPRRSSNELSQGLPLVFIPTIPSRLQNTEADMGAVSKPSHSFDPSSLSAGVECQRKPVRRINKKPCQHCQTHRYKCNINPPFSLNRCARCTKKGVPCTWTQASKGKPAACKTQGGTFQGPPAASMPVTDILDHSRNDSAQEVVHAHTFGEARIQTFHDASRNLSQKSNHIPSTNDFFPFYDPYIGEPPPNIVDYEGSRHCYYPPNPSLMYQAAAAPIQYYQPVPVNGGPSGPLPVGRTISSASSLGFNTGVEAHMHSGECSPISPTSAISMSPYDARFPHRF